jgi:hypothetical protein
MNPKSPISPDPRRIIVAGSGTGALTLTGIIGKHPSIGITINELPRGKPRGINE